MSESFNSTAATADLSCENCNAINLPTQKFCTQCSFPVGGNDEEKTKFRLIVSSRKRLLKDVEEKIKSAKTIIYVLAGFALVMGLVFGLVNDDFPTMIMNLFLSVIYLILAAWSNKNPFGAILTAFIIYITLIVINAFFDPATIIQGIIIKIFFIGALIKGTRSAKEAEGFKKELEKLKAVPVGNN